MCRTFNDRIHSINNPRSKSIVMTIAVSFILAHSASARTLGDAIRAHLADITGTRANKTRVGIKIVAASTGRVIYQRNPTVSFIPASNMKLVTTAAAMTILGPDFRFKTRFGIHNRDLVILASGDPSLGDPVLATDTPVVGLFARIATQLLDPAHPVRPRRIVIDTSIFDKNYRHPNWPENQRDRWYAAPVTALNINDNCLDLYAGRDRQRRPYLRIQPPCNFIQRNVAFIPKSIKRTIISPRWGPADWQLSVKVTLGAKSVGPAWLPIEDPPAFVGEWLRERLAAAGIRVPSPADATIREPNGAPPDGFTLLFEHRSPDLAALIQRANTNSQNLFAECLFKKVGRQFARPLAPYSVGSWHTGRLAVREFLRSTLKIDLDGIVIDDGSGLSRHNRLTPKALVKLLRYALDQPWADAFAASLARAGETGTLRRRLRRTAAVGRVHAKTGYIANVKALSGYVTNRQGRPAIVFAMLVNGSLTNVRQAEDRICIEMVKHADTMIALKEAPARHARLQ